MANEALGVRHDPATGGSLVSATRPFDPEQAKDVIPACLRERRQWVCWRFIVRSGKTTKCPMCPNRRGEASSTDPATWGTFDEAIAACKERTDLAGVGFVFSADDPFTGIDLDNCIHGSTGEVKAWARPIVARLDSYSEVSPSGKGVKVFVRASKSGARCKTGYEDGAIEMYDRDRFFTVTSRSLHDPPKDVADRQSVIDALYAQVFGAPPAGGAAQPDPSNNGQLRLDDDEILRLAYASRKSGAKFASLWAGRWNDHFNSRSEADSSVVFTLAFFTKNAAQIDRIFRRSGLMREKWDERHGQQTYGEMTIAKALETVTRQYKPRKQRSEGRSDAIAYRATPSGLVWDKPTRDGDVSTPLTNFTAKIVADVSRDDGVEATHVFTIEAMLNGRKSTFDVQSGRFSGLGWVAENLGAKAIVYPGFACKDHARAAIQLLSDDVASRTVFTHLGWRKFDGRYVYLHAGGAIASAAPTAPEIEVDTGSELARFTLPTPPSGRRAVEAVAASLRTFELAADAVILPVFAAIWRSVLGPCDFAIHLSGASGSFKTEVAALAQQHFGAELDARNLPGSWSSTGNSLEALAFSAKDALLVVDDFAPSGTPYDVARLHREAARLIRAQGNRSGRGRLRADATLRPSKCPRGLILSTGEDIPAGHSIRARIGVVEIGARAIGQPELTRCQRDARHGLYAEAMAAFLYWLSSRYDDIRLSQETAELRERAGSEPGTHRRTPAMVASLFLGIRYFARFAREIGVFDAAEADAFERRCWASLATFAAAQAAHLQSADPVERFCTLLASALASGRAHVADRDGEAPQPGGSNDEKTPTSWGWRRVTMGTGQHAREEWRPQGDRVGWYDAAGNDLYLDIESAVRVAQMAAPAGADAILVSARTLVKRLKEKGCLRSTDESRDKNTVQRVLQGQRRNVVHLETSALTCGSRAQWAQRAQDPGSGVETVDRAPETCARNDADEGLRAHARAHSRGREGRFAPNAPEAPEMGANTPAQQQATSQVEPDGVLEDLSEAQAILGETLTGLEPEVQGPGQ